MSFILRTVSMSVKKDDGVFCQGVFFSLQDGRTSVSRMFGSICLTNRGRDVWFFGRKL